MKILRVQLENLNSLRGKHVINFMDPVFVAGLFAITGPTGAGKSTVLDAICLALFHRTPRQENVGQGQNGLMSTGTGECSAEVEFATGGKSYRATWTQHRARRLAGGALQQPRASLSDLEGNLITERANETKNAISGVLGLSFEQFSRSVLLAQGGFDAFLKARDNERADLLERLTGTEVYGEISKTVHDRTRDESDAVRLLKGQQGNIALMTEEEQAATQEALQQAQAAHLAADLQRRDSELALQWINDLDRFTVAIEKVKSDIDQIEQEWIGAQPQLHELTQGERAEPFRGLYEGLVRTRNHHDAYQKKLSSLEQQVADTEDLQRSATWQTLASARATLQVSRLALDRHQVAVEGISGALFALGVEGNLGECLVNWRQLGKAVSICVTQLDEETVKAEAAITLVSVSDEQVIAAREHAQQRAAELDQAAAALETAQKEVEEALAGRTRDEMVEQIHLLQMRRERLEALIPINSRRQKAADQYASTIKRLDTARAAEEGLRGTTERLQAELDAAKETRATLDEALKNARHILSLSEERDRLVPGEACPLCGSAEHPAIETYKAVEPAKFERQWKIQDQLVDRLNGQVEQARSEHVRCQDRIAGAKDDLAVQASVADDAQEEWLSACLALQVSPENDQHLHTLIQSALDDHAEVDQLRKLVDAREEVAGEARRALDAAKTAYRSASESVGLREATSIAAIEKKSQAQERVTEAKARLVSAQEELRCALPGGVVPDDFEEWLEAKTQSWVRFKDLSQQQAQLKTSLPSLQHDQVSASKKVSEWEEAWRRGEWESCESVEGSPDRFALLVQEVEGCVSALMRLEGELHASTLQEHEAEAAKFVAEKEWAAAMDGSGFESNEDLVAAFLAPDELKRLRAIRDGLANRRVQAQAVYTERARQLQSHKENPKTDKPRDEVQRELERLTADSSSLHAQVISYSTRLNSDSEQRQMSALLLAQIEIAQREFDDWQHLNGLVGSANGQKFRRFAQGLTLDRLVYLANRHLHNLDGGHFSISRSPIDLGLMVEDAWDAGARRDASTLSGGETFLVSLALALGLSDLVSQNIQIDSFFLDEGFGTLDPDALAQAMDAIESLNASGKLIGVISHVDLVKERIPVQIKVLPTSRLGSSRLELPSLS